MKIIVVNSPKYGKKEVLVDDSDYDYLNKFSWHVYKAEKKDTFYVYRMTSRKLGKQTSISMHREVMGCTTGDGKIIDHKDRNGLNNQRGNIRFSSHSQNMMNKKSHKGSTSKHKGVSFHRATTRNKRKTGVWIAYINVNKKRSHIGYFKTEHEAAKAYNERAKELHGEFANLNII